MVGIAGGCQCGRRASPESREFIERIASASPACPASCLAVSRSVSRCLAVSHSSRTRAGPQSARPPLDPVSREPPIERRPREDESLRRLLGGEPGRGRRRRGRRRRRRGRGGRSQGERRRQMLRPDRLRPRDQRGRRGAIDRDEQLAHVELPAAEQARLDEAGARGRRGGLTFERELDEERDLLRSSAARSTVSRDGRARDGGSSRPARATACRRGPRSADGTPRAPRRARGRARRASAAAPSRS